MTDIRQSLGRQGLVRPTEGRVLGGVVAGLGRRFGIDPWPARLLFVLLLMVVPGSQILIYPVLWILMPTGGVVRSRAGLGGSTCPRLRLDQHPIDGRTESIEGPTRRAFTRRG